MPAFLRFGTREANLTLTAAVLGSGMAFLDATAVNIALPALGDDLGAGLADFQWVVNGYLVAMGALLLTGGALADVHGRRKVFLVGTTWFALASLLCAAAPSTLLLIVARGLQGVGAALMVPASLAMIQAGFHPDDRGRAIGVWAGLSGLATLVGPVLGGWLVEAVSWRAIFLINPAVALIALGVAWRGVPHLVPGGGRKSVDSVGAVTATGALGGLVFALIQGPVWGWSHAAVVAAFALAFLSGAAFLDMERSTAQPMLPLEFFGRRQFTGANATTLAVYFALSGTFFVLSLQLQRVMGYSPLQAGLAMTPVTLSLLVLSPLAGRYADRRGPRLPMTVGPAVAALGLVLLAGLGMGGGAYRTDVLPGLGVFALGLGIAVAPLTTAALGALEDRHAGLASGVNNAVARVAQLLAIALLPLMVGLSGVERVGGVALAHGFGLAMRVGAGILLLGSAVAWVMVRDE